MSATRFLPKFSIGIKIFGIATSMLVLLVAMVGINYDRIKKVIVISIKIETKI